MLELEKTGLDEISGLDHYDENVVRRLIVREQKFSKTAVQIFLRDRNLRAVINLFFPGAIPLPVS